MKKKKLPKWYKESDLRGIFIKRYYREVAIVFSKLLMKTSITANQVTIFRGILIFPTAALFMFGNYYLSLFGAFMVLFTHFLDWVDGIIARMRNQITIMGGWLSYFDCIMVPLFFFGIAFGEFIKTNNPYMLIYGFLIVIAYRQLDDIYHGFKKTSNKSSTYIENFSKKRSFLKNFFFGDHFIFNTMFIAALFNVLNYYIYACLIYSWFSLFVAFFIFYIKLSKQDKLNKK